MAKSKQQKRKSRREREQAFYEALPAALTTNIFPAMADSITPKIDSDNLRRYGQAALDDIIAASRFLARKLTGRRARLLYLALASTGALALTVVGTTLAASTYSLYASDISSPAALLDKKKTGTTILDRNGQVLYAGYGGQATTIVPLSDMPQSLKDATLAAEDPGFYSHPGFSWRGTARAAVVDLTQHGKVEGGSTLTQQLVKNALLTSNKSFVRKYQEILLSMELERRYSKDQILQMYLNEVYYGQGTSGVEAASETYFHKHTKDLNLSESALLAGLPLGPSRFDPNVDLQAATDRRNYVLDRMASLGKITQKQAKATEAEPIEASARQITIKAPHFVFYVLDQLRAQYGDDMVEHGGLTVTTTLDLTKQEAAEGIVKAQVDRLASHHVTNGGLVSLNPTNGDIISMVGSVDYNQPGFGNVNVTLAQLQPGSSFKPIAYATAFEKGWSGATHVDDKPVSFPNGDGTVYKPMNYDLKFRGSVSLRRALSNSLNIPAIEVLQYAGIPQTLATAHAMGITTLNDPSRYGLSLVLGGGEVRPIDMATVYSTFAANGVRTDPHAVLKVADRYGKDITKKTDHQGKNVLDPRIAYMITNILSDNTARSEEFGPNSPLKLSRPAAAKTGTTNDFRDNWTVGYTPSLATAVWVGNNDHSAMENVDGITGAAPIWHDYMEMALAGTPVQNFTPPAGVVTLRVCSADGGLANPWDAGNDEVFLTESQPTKHCGTPAPQSSATPSPTSSPDAAALNTPAATEPPPDPGRGGGPSDNGGPGPNNSPTPAPTPVCRPASCRPNNQ